MLSSKIFTYSHCGLCIEQISTRCIYMPIVAWKGSAFELSEKFFLHILQPQLVKCVLITIDEFQWAL